MKEKLCRMIGSRAFALFLLFWLSFGATTNLNDVRAYNLQQMGVDAVVSHHTFGLGLSKAPQLQPLGDTFRYGDHTLAAKQPGQFVFGAVPYFFLNLVGITYERNYDLAATLVTWLSAGLIGALALAFLDRLLNRVWGFSRSASLLATLSVGLASPWLCYAGIAHHDLIAGSLIMLALYAMESDRIQHNGRSTKLALTAGALLGLTVFTSMLPALIVLVMGLSILFSRPFKTTLIYGLGFFIGILPLLAYNGWYFGSPFTPANVAGNYADTFFSFKLDQFLHHLNAYLGFGGLALWKYAPVLMLALAGLVLLPKSLSHVKKLLFIAIGMHFFYLLNIETLGTCEYGPRYLLPLLPLLAPGVAALLDVRASPTAAMSRLLIAGGLLMTSLLINLVGALQGTMYCNLEEFALWQQIGAVPHLPDGHLPVFWLCAGIGLVALAVATWQRFGFGEKLDRLTVENS